MVRGVQRGRDRTCNLGATAHRSGVGPHGGSIRSPLLPDPVRSGGQAGEGCGGRNLRSALPGIPLAECIRRAIESAQEPRQSSELADSLESSGKATRAAEAERDAALAKIDRWRGSWVQLEVILEAVLPPEQLEEAQPIPQAVAWLAAEWKLGRSELTRLRAVTEAMAIAAATHETALYELRRERDSAAAAWRETSLELKDAVREREEMRGQAFGAAAAFETVREKLLAAEVERDAARESLERIAAALRATGFPGIGEETPWTSIGRIEEARAHWQRLGDEWHGRTVRCPSGHLSDFDRPGCPECELVEVRVERDTWLETVTLAYGALGFIHEHDGNPWWDVVATRYREVVRERDGLRTQIGTHPERIHAAVRANGEVLRLLRAAGVTDPRLSLVQCAEAVIGQRDALQRFTEDHQRGLDEACKALRNLECWRDGDSLLAGVIALAKRGGATPSPAPASRIIDGLLDGDRMAFTAALVWLIDHGVSADLSRLEAA